MELNISLSQLKTDNEVYKNWPFRTRYLRRECWDAMKKIILEHNITSALEFGSGLSTILMNNLGLDIVSCETDPVYLRKIKSFNLANVDFRLWDNNEVEIEGYFGIALVDGIIPRTRQLHYAQLHSRYIAIDDFNDFNSNEGLEPMLSKYTRLDDGKNKLAIFRRFNSGT